MILGNEIRLLITCVKSAGVCALTASWLPLSVKYLYQLQKSECWLYQLMFLRLRISLLCRSAAADLSRMLSPAGAGHIKRQERGNR